ncbi:MAG: response regulator [Chloroflexi bacterium]|nr:response regulator [Chloroflexota bacterium]
MTKILIVDDECDVRESLSDALTDAGFQVAAAPDGAEALILIAEQAFDLVLLDMMMPGIDGIQLIRVLDRIAPGLPLIGLTGYLGKGYMSHSAAYGITCLSKPVPIADLIREINETVALRKNAKAG